MLVEKEIQRLLKILASGDPVKIAQDGSEIFVRYMDNLSKLSLTTAVYEGGNYIPSSVRKCLSHKFSHIPSIRTYLTIDEDHFKIHLNYLGQAPRLTDGHFESLIEEFTSLAEKWRLYLDKHDKDDLVYVRVK